MDNYALLNLLQLASPALPVGAYSYSEGLESLIESQAIANREQLDRWIVRELQYGSIRVEAAIAVRAYRSFSEGNLAQLQYWNAWLSASRETQELRQQSWQMGRSLLQLLANLQGDGCADLSVRAFVPALSPCNYAVAFGIAAVLGNIPLETAAIAYLHSWATNLIGAGVKLIPLGQTAGQQLLASLRDRFAASSQEILGLTDESLDSCNWGLTMASMAHETQYTRLFRS